MAKVKSSPKTEKTTSQKYEINLKLTEKGFRWLEGVRIFQGYPTMEDYVKACIFSDISFLQDEILLDDIRAGSFEE